MKWADCDGKVSCADDVVCSSARVGQDPVSMSSRLDFGEERLCDGVVTVLSDQ